MTSPDDLKRRRDAALRMPPINNTGDRDPLGYDKPARHFVRPASQTLVMLLHPKTAQRLTPDDGRVAWPHANEHERALLTKLFGAPGGADAE